MTVNTSPVHSASYFRPGIIRPRGQGMYMPRGIRYIGSSNPALSTRAALFEKPKTVGGNSTVARPTTSTAASPLQSALSNTASVKPNASAAENSLLSTILSGVEEIVERVLERVMDNAIKKLMSYIDSLFGVAPSASSVSPSGAATEPPAVGSVTLPAGSLDGSIGGGSMDGGIDGSTGGSIDSGAGFTEGFCSSSTELPHVTLYQNFASNQTQNATSDSRSGGLFDQIGNLLNGVGPVANGIRTILGKGKDLITGAIGMGGSLLSNAGSWVGGLFG